MTFVHSHQPSAIGRADEGAALQRRLLQDLERQWLDSWTVADQMQAKAAPAPEAQPQAEVQDPTQALSAGLPASTSGTGVQTQAAPVGNAMSSPAPSPASPDSIESTSGEPLTAAPGAGSQVMPVAGKQAAPSDAQAASFSEPQKQPAAASAALVGSNDEPGLPAEIDASSSQPPAQPLQGTPAASVLSGNRAETFEPALPPAPSAAVQAKGKTTTLGMTPGATGRPSEPDTPGQETSAASRQSFKLTSTENEPGPRHLMLRETSDESVLATMRDTELGSAQSQLAADGLARALMEAGYARVQVVVNGQQHRRDRSESVATTTDRSSPNEQKPTTSTFTLQERRNGR